MDPQVNALLPFLLRRENVARYEEGVVVIGDRRAYPFERAFVRCPDVESVARAIEGMGHPGGRPDCCVVCDGTRRARSGRAARNTALSPPGRPASSPRARPTPRLRGTRGAMSVLQEAYDTGAPLVETVLAWIEARRDQRYADYAAGALWRQPDGGRRRYPRHVLRRDGIPPQSRIRRARGNGCTSSRRRRAPTSRAPG